MKKLLFVGAVAVGVLLLGSSSGVSAQNAVKTDKFQGKSYLMLNTLVMAVNPWAWPNVNVKEAINLDKIQDMPYPRNLEKYKPLKRALKKPKKLEM